MKKLKLFLENFIIYGFGGIINKLIPLIMIPVITKLMPNKNYFGISDMANTIVSFGAAIAVMGMYDAMYRMFFEKDDEAYRKRVCSTTVVFIYLTAVIVGLLTFLLRNVLARYFLGSPKYSFIIYYVAFNVMTDTVNTIIASPTRMQNHRKTYLTTNAVGPLVSYALSIVLLKQGHYYIAMPLGLLCSSLTIHVIYLIINRKWFDVKLFDFTLLKSMLPIGIPMAVNVLTYWVFHSCDRLMITNLMNVGEAGVYAIGSKLGHASQLVYTAFAAGWQYFAFSTMKEGDQVESNSAVFEYLGAISFVITMFVCAISFPVFNILFPGEYLPGYIVSPYLFLAPLLLMLFQVIANQFLVIKKTWPNMLILIVGAASNVLFNYLLIPVMGIEGAAIGTLIGYAISLVLASAVLIKMKLLVIKGRFCLAVCAMAAVMTSWRLSDGDAFLRTLAFAVAGSAVVVLLYLKDIKGLLEALKKATENRSKV